jgi:hypothetical protein
MCTIVCLAPIIVVSWPVMAAVVVAAAGAMGFAVVQEAAAQVKQTTDAKTCEEIEVKESEILPSTEGTGEQLVVEREGVRAVFSRDGRGALRVAMEGHGVSRTELRRIGEELVGRVTQQYVYNRLITELKERNMMVVDEEVTEDQAVRIRLRNW